MVGIPSGLSFWFSFCLRQESFSGSPGSGAAATFGFSLCPPSSCGFSVVGCWSKRLSPPFLQQRADAPAPSLHGRYSLLRYYGPVRLPTGAASRVIYSPSALVPPRGTTPSGLPGSSTDLSPRAVPYHPGRPRRCPCPLLHGGDQASSSGGGWP